MEEKYYPLGSIDDNMPVKILRIVFGVACLGIAVWWINYNIHLPEADWTLWITVAFLTLFGLYQIWAGLGRTRRFVVFRDDSIIIKKNPLSSPVNIRASEIVRIEIYPLSIVFVTNKKFLLRFGTVNYETNEKIVDELIRFAEKEGIQYELKEEEI